jgi:hypothetical protein
MYKQLNLMQACRKRRMIKIPPHFEGIGILAMIWADFQR